MASVEKLLRPQHAKYSPTYSTTKSSHLTKTQQQQRGWDKRSPFYYKTKESNGGSNTVKSIS